MAVLLHLSDTHFGTERTRVVEALLRCLARQTVDVAVMSGDITQRARPAEFRLARAFVDRLRALLPAVPLLVLPGNHDIPLFDLRRRLFRPFGSFRRTFGEALEPEYEDDSLQLQLVNTVTRWRHTAGVVDADQIERVAHRLAAARPGQLRVVVTHQPLAVTRGADAADLARGHAAAIQRWGLAGADLLLGGHIHLPYVQPLTVADTLGPVRRLWVVQAGTAVSRRIRHEAGNSFNLIRHGAGACVVERWDYQEAADDFACCMRTPLALDRH
ncbi:DNA repair exonuclease [Azoarcus sp. DD4]|uniref:metallophosphoesterase family protein n=1 Tax=Azoarcus sp. DD4 TaxID=2027405 RepID=UPI0011286B01|nr:metallophosphoesterase [Azoarcus sp. DD4]QDF95227.1 DNA repair exonuclease [Azoarcus sp. DD4]